MKKRIIYLCSFLIGLGGFNTSFANEPRCPDDIECTTPDDMSSCFCRYNEVKTNKWVVTPDGEEGAYIMKGIYNFHNAAINLSKENPSTETACSYTFQEHDSEARISCKAKSANLMPLLDANTMWKLIATNYGVQYLCGNYNQIAEKTMCPLK